MGIEAVQQEIISQAEKINNERISEAEKKAKAIKEEAILLIKTEEEKADEEIRILLEQLKATIETSAKFEIKKLELTSRRDMLNKVFLQVEEKIKKLDDSTLQRLTKNLLKEAQSEIPVGLIICNEKTEKWMPADISIKTENMLGGVIAETTDGKLRVDNRFEAILERVRKDSLKTIAKNVFSKKTK